MAPGRKFDLKGYFDRVVLINLPGRPDRLARVKEALYQCQWPFKQPEIFAAVDGTVTRPLPSWRFGAGAWGCLKSHEQVLLKALADGVKNILVMEDDVCFADDFRAGVEEFLRQVPDDWDQLMLGGQQVNKNGAPVLVKPGIYRCTDCERTHGYAVRGDYMRKLCERWQGGGKFDGLAHCDYIMGRDPDLQLAHQVYAPDFFLLGQERSRSDVAGQVIPRKFWNPPGPGLSVINLHAPAPVARALMPHGFFMQQTADHHDGQRRTLDQIFKETENNLPERVKVLSDWIKLVQWELAADPAFVCTLWHPQATPELVKAASIWKVHEITAESVESALKQLPPALRQSLAANKSV